MDTLGARVASQAIEANSDTSRHEREAAVLGLSNFSGFPAPPCPGKIDV
jgi:hypothetical protein